MKDIKKIVQEAYLKSYKHLAKLEPAPHPTPIPIIRDGGMIAKEFQESIEAELGGVMVGNPRFTYLENVIEYLEWLRDEGVIQ